MGRRIGAEDRSFVRSTAGESGESEHEGCCHDRGGCFERAWEEHGGGDDEDDEGGLVGKGGGESHSTPSHATPGGKTTKTREKKRQNTETPPPPPRQVKKSKTAAGINGQKPKTPPGRQASVVSDRPHQNKTTVLTWLGPGTTEAGGGGKASEGSLAAQAQAQSEYSLVHSMHSHSGEAGMPLSLCHPYLRSYVRVAVPTCCLPCMFVRGYARVAAGI